jgi:hypothetical protein
MINIFLFSIISFFILMGNAYGTFVSGSTGADGAFNPASNTELQMPSSGVFNFTTVNIPYNVTVTFKKNAANTPVYILATGNVTITGTISVNGKNCIDTAAGGKGGPGGFDGGNGGYVATASLPGGKGSGPGGGGGGSSTCAYGGGGSYGSAGTTYTGTNCGAAGSVYGNPELQPLTGGSGGGGAYASNGGGGGGGAILIASSGTINIVDMYGFITANGGNGSSKGAGGSGGAIRLIANTITGNGSIESKGGTGGGGTAGGGGRIRLEAYTVNRTVGPVFVYYPPASVFLANTPTLKITSIGGVNAPASPSGSFSTPDIILPSTTTNPVTVTLNASYIPVGTTVTVSVLPQFGNAGNVAATLSGTLETSTASAAVTLPSGSYASVIQAYAVYTLQTAFYWEGEKIDRVRVAANLGGESETVYITESGREIKSAELMAKLNGW